MIRRNAGFTLTEVLVALVITATALVIIAQGFSAGAQASTSSQRLTRAVMLAEGKMTEFETGEIALSSAPSGDFKPDYPDFSWSSTIESGSFGSYHVTVTVTWSERGEPQTYSLARVLTERPAPQ
jgi:prepilin-type N-terminal cleavage/methylation domain-containing protein